MRRTRYRYGCAGDPRVRDRESLQAVDDGIYGPERGYPVLKEQTNLVTPIKGPSFGVRVRMSQGFMGWYWAQWRFEPAAGGDEIERPGEWVEIPAGEVTPILLRFRDASHVVEGDWTLALAARGQVVLEKTFTVAHSIGVEER